MKIIIFPNFQFVLAACLYQPAKRENRKASPIQRWPIILIKETYSISEKKLEKNEKLGAPSRSNRVQSLQTSFYQVFSEDFT